MFREKVKVGDLVVIKGGSERIGIIKRIWEKGLFETYYDVRMLDTGIYKVLKRKEFKKVTNQ